VANASSIPQTIDFGGLLIDLASKWGDWLTSFFSQRKTVAVVTLELSPGGRTKAEVVSDWGFPVILDGTGRRVVIAGRGRYSGQLMALAVMAVAAWFPGVAAAAASPAKGESTAGSPSVDEPIWRSLPATSRPTSRDAMHVPTFEAGAVNTLRIRGRFAYLVRPTGKIDGQKRWVWIFPFEHGLQDARGGVQYRFYIEKLLAAGFHIAAISVGVSCGSPTAAEVCQDFYRQIVSRHGLNRRARLLAQSNGGLIAYAWAFRHPDCVDRIAGIYPATDLRAWPGVDKLRVYPVQGLGYNISADELARRLSEFNPIDNLAPLAKARVKILHLHGDRDKLVPLEMNSAALVRRYKKLGGSGELIAVPGYAHGGAPFVKSHALADFLLAD